jgi:Flp pilus assembly protein TadD
VINRLSAWVRDITTAAVFRIAWVCSCHFVVLTRDVRTDMVDDDAIAPIVAALRTGDLVVAERLCRAALQRWPDEPKLLFLLGYGLRQQGRPQAAVESFSHLVEVCPDEVTHWSNYAAVLALVGDIEAAAHAAAAAVRLDPDNPETLERLGWLQLQCGSPVDAHDALMRAHDLAPDHVDICLHAARACIACRDQRADDLLRPWREWLPLDEAQQRTLAELLVEVGEVWDAVELLEEAVRREPTDWPSVLLLAKVYERVNRPRQAREVLDRVVAGVPAGDAAIAHEIQVQQAQLAMRRRSYGAARALLEQAGPWSAEEAGHYFALAKACDQLGDTAAAMHALATAHALEVEELRASNPDLLEQDAPWLPHVDDRVSAANYRTWPTLHAPDADQSPVFVVGFPRSGTTLLEQMLDAHPRLQSMDERPFLNRLGAQLADVGVEVPGGLTRLNQRDCDELRKGYVLMGCGKVARSWDTRLVDKNPLNMLWLPLLHRMFPHAKLVLAVRHPCDVILSCYLQEFRAAPLVAACRSLEHLAHAYAAAMENWLYHAALFRVDVMVSRYEDLVADPPSQAGGIAAFLGVDDAAAMLRFAARAREKGYIRTPSYSKVVEPISRQAVGHWQRYREYFEPALPILEPMLDHWGYSAAAASAVSTTSHGH